MTPLKSKINRFFYNNRDKGIPNLMLYIAIGNVLVYVLYLLNPENEYFTGLLALNPALLLRGQVWRLFTHVFLFLRSSGFLGVIELLFLIWAGKVLEQYWGTLRFNAYYLLGVILTDLAMIVLYLTMAASETAGALYLSGYMTTTVNDVNLSILLALATVAPDEQVYFWFILPIKLKWLAWVYFAYVAYELITYFVSSLGVFLRTGSVMLFWLLPIVPLLNYFLFFGKGIVNVMPDFIRYRRKKPKQTKTRASGFHVGGQQNYRFKCTVCGRTELSDPKLEFRYCSKCSGYRCYCEEHIHNHVHITE